MALSVAIRGGVEPAATTDTTLHTATKTAHVFVKAANKGSVAALIRVAVRPLGAAIADAHYDLYDFSLPANDRLQLGPYSLLNTDVITVRASTADVTFRFDGWEEP